MLISIPKQDRSGLRIHGNKRLLCKILSITKHKSPRYELASEHGTFNKLYAAGDLIQIPSCVLFTPVESTKKISLRTAVKITYAPLNLSAMGRRRSRRLAISL